LQLGITFAVTSEVAGQLNDVGEKRARYQGGDVIPGAL
jgi:hypothetical protein